MLCIVDYGVGNLFSLQSSFAALGKEALVSGDPDLLKKADKLILPGVGAFADAAEKLRKDGLDRLLMEKAAEGTPILGICLGMQLLLEESMEHGLYKGLGLIPGVVRPIAEEIPAELKIPQIGWNTLQYPERKHPLFASLKDKDRVYFVHSYYAAAPEEFVIARTEYGAPLTAAVAKDNVMGCQFHPEKSGPVGLKILENFCSMEA